MYIYIYVYVHTYVYIHTYLCIRLLYCIAYLLMSIHISFHRDLRLFSYCFTFLLIAVDISFDQIDSYLFLHTPISTVFFFKIYRCLYTSLWIVMSKLRVWCIFSFWFRVSPTVTPVSCVLHCRQLFMSLLILLYIFFDIDVCLFWYWCMSLLLFNSSLPRIVSCALLCR